MTVNGATAGGDVVCFAVAKEPNDSFPPIPLKTQHAVLLQDADLDGKVIFERTRAVPLIAVWIAVDVTTGQWAASGSPGFDAQIIPPDEFAKHDNAGQLRKLSAQVPEMDVLLVRPRTGAWRIYTAKTSAIDEGGATKARSGSMFVKWSRYPDLEATNHLAEKAIRPAGINRKTSGGNRTFNGAHAQAVIMSVLRTAKLRSVSSVDVLADMLRAPLSLPHPLMR